MQSIEMQVRREWIGPAPKMSHVVAVFYIGIVGVMIAGLQPLLLGTLQAAGSLTAGELGHAATAELLTMGLAAGAAGAWLKPRGLRWIGLTSALALAAVDLVTLQVRHDAVTAIRALAFGVGCLAAGMAIVTVIHRKAARTR